MIEFDWRAIGIVAAVFFGLALTFRLIGQYAASKLIDIEFEHVLNSEEHKVRGRYE